MAKKKNKKKRHLFMGLVLGAVTALAIKQAIDNTQYAAEIDRDGSLLKINFPKQNQVIKFDLDLNRIISS